MLIVGLNNKYKWFLYEFKIILVLFVFKDEIKFNLFFGCIKKDIKLSRPEEIK